MALFALIKGCVLVGGSVWLEAGFDVSNIKRRDPVVFFPPATCKSDVELSLSMSICVLPASHHVDNGLNL